MAVIFNCIRKKSGRNRGCVRAGCKCWCEQVEEISETVEAAGSWFEARRIVKVVFNILEEQTGAIGNAVGIPSTNNVKQNTEVVVNASEYPTDGPWPAMVPETCVP